MLTALLVGLAILNMVAFMMIKVLIKELRRWQKEALISKEKYCKLATRYAPKE